MVTVKVSRALGSAVEDGAVGMGMEGAAETPGTLSDIPDTRVLWVLRRK